MKKTLFTIDGRDYTQGQFAAYLKKYQRPIKGESSVEIEVNRLYNNYVAKVLIELEDDNLSKKYPEFRYLVNEYRDGILLFDLTEKKVWNKAMEDTVGLENYYNAHVAEFQWKERMDVVIFTAKDAKLAKKVKKALKRDKEPRAIASELNNNNALNLQLDSAVAQRGEHADLDALEWKPGIYTVELEDGRVMVYGVREILEPGNKSLDEAKGLAIAGYQKQLEEEWIAELRAKYPVVVNDEVFNSLPKQ
jgi:peptidyl-prolyl cis-trans isomerase SurA